MNIKKNIKLLSIILNLENHNNFLLKKNIVSINQYSIYNIKINSIIKKINNIDNKKNNKNNNVNLFLQFKNKDDVDINDDYIDIKLEIINLCKYIGCFSFHDILYLLNYYYKSIYNKNTLELINLYDKLIKIIKIKIIDKSIVFDILNNKKIISNNLLLNNNNLLEIYIFNNNNNNNNLFFNITILIKLYNNVNDFILIDGFIYNNNNIKSLTTIYKIINKKKKKLNIKNLNNNQLNNFYKLYYNNLDIYELLLYDIEDIGLSVINNYKLYEKYMKMTIIDLIKMINNEKDHMLIFTCIRLLFMDEKGYVNGNILLLYLKNNNYNLYQKIIFNLNKNIYNKINIDIKYDFNNVINNKSDKNNIKSKILLNNNIPYHIKLITLDKLEELKDNNDVYKQNLFINTILEFPWISNDNNDIFKVLKKCKAKRIKFIDNLVKNLDKICYGHNKTKDILVDNICKWISNSNSNGTVLGLYGPPGVGKTLLCKGLSKAINIPLITINLGGQTDGDLLFGHSYTYSNSQPGIIIKKMVENKKSRIIFYFDELDKLCTKHNNTNNEIINILIHLIDSESSRTFQDKFFQGIDFDLSQVIFIFSYNNPSIIDPILLNRITQIKIESYNVNDKIIIAKKYIIPKLLDEFNFNKNEIIFNNEIIENIINNYTYEAGVRDLKRCIEQLILKLNRYKLTQKNIYIKKIKKYTITNNFVNNHMQKNMNIEQKYNINIPGIINGLYATDYGIGGITTIQISKKYIQGEFILDITGNQGLIMKESIKYAYNSAIHYLETIKKIDINVIIKEKFPYGFHIHTLDPGISKDGPSAGAAFTCAFISLILNKKIKSNISISGEIDLYGDIYRIGGLNSKLNAAKKLGINTVYISNENKNDIKKINNKLIDNTFNVCIIKNIKDFILNILT